MSITVAFVDDEPRILAGLRRALLRRRPEWRVRFHTDPEELLRQAAVDGAPDAVVSDAHMPLMDGRDLLRRVAREHPGTIRVLLSGQVEHLGGLDVAQVAHQFLNKPCDVDELVGAIERVATRRAELRSPALIAAVAGMGSLPSPSARHRQLQAILADPEATPHDVATILERDVGLSAKLLQLVNSAFFGMARRFTDLTATIAYLGLDTVGAIVVATRLQASFADVDPAWLDRYVARSHEVATRARELAPPGTSDAFAIGLLADVGELVIAAGHPGPLLTDDVGVREVDISVNGVSHARIGAALLALWGLPDDIVDAVAHHHQPSVVGPGLHATGVVHLADQTTRLARGLPAALDRSWAQTLEDDADAHLVDLGPVAADLLRRS